MEAWDTMNTLLDDFLDGKIGLFDEMLTWDGEMKAETLRIAQKLDVGTVIEIIFDGFPCQQVANQPVVTVPIVGAIGK